MGTQSILYALAAQVKYPSGRSMPAFLRTPYLPRCFLEHGGELPETDLLHFPARIDCASMLLYLFSIYSAGNSVVRHCGCLRDSVH